MGRVVFLALAILGLDLLLYFLFQWTYGDRNRRRSKDISRNRTKHDIPAITEIPRADDRRKENGGRGVGKPRLQHGLRGEAVKPGSRPGGERFGNLQGNEEVAGEEISVKVAERGRDS